MTGTNETKVLVKLSLTDEEAEEVLGELDLRMAIGWSDVFTNCRGGETESPWVAGTQKKTLDDGTVYEQVVEAVGYVLAGEGWQVKVKFWGEDYDLLDISGSKAAVVNWLIAHKDLNADEVLGILDDIRQKDR